MYHWSFGIHEARRPTQILPYAIEEIWNETRQCPRSVALNDRNIWWSYCEPLACHMELVLGSQFSLLFTSPQSVYLHGKCSSRNSIKRPFVLMYLWAWTGSKTWPHRPTRTALTFVQNCRSHGRYLDQSRLLSLISVPSVHYRSL